MPKLRTYQCNGTPKHPPHVFTYLHHPSVEIDPLPRYCGVCGFDSEGEEPVETLSAPHIGKSIRGVVDTMHREMEQGAEHRANMAREHYGMDADDVRPMLETNMRDGLREGDTSEAKLAPSPVTQIMETAPPGMFGFQGAQGVGYSGPVSEGMFPNAGARAQQAVRRRHSQFTRDAGQVGATSSDLPAVETLAPGYRKRVT